MASDAIDLEKIQPWLAPLGDGDEPCGKDFEYENEFLELSKAAEGKPETQFGPGEPPLWRDVREKAEELLEKTRDLRVAMLWVRANIHLHGFSAFPVGLALLEGLLTNFWDHLHPVPDDGDAYARANTLAILPEGNGVLGDLRQSALFSIRSVGELRMRSIEIGLGLLNAPEGEEAMSKDQMSQMLASAIEQLPSLPDQLTATQEGLKSLAALMNDKLGAEGAPDLKPLVLLIKGTVGLLPQAQEEEANEDTGEMADGVDGAPQSKGGPRMSGSVQSRADAVRAIDMVCEYLERTEPTNPAPLLLRRARKLINHNFLQLIKELAPEALPEAAKLMGVDPDSVNFDNVQ
jgi:type VI secretion system protein ImpA